MVTVRGWYAVGCRFDSWEHHVARGEIIMAAILKVAVHSNFFCIPSDVAKSFMVGGLKVVAHSSGRGLVTWR